MKLGLEKDLVDALSPRARKILNLCPESVDLNTDPPVVRGKYVYSDPRLSERDERVLEVLLIALAVVSEIDGMKPKQTWTEAVTEMWDAFLVWWRSS